MGLEPGARLGPYEVVVQVGAGAMGEVYAATDSNLKRSVALKVLPDSVAFDPGRLARFHREAEALAALNHANIAQIHGLETSGSRPALVMELVEGPTLAERLERGPVTVDEALRIAKQIADALEAAHERGIVHRDLKPANIKLRPDGVVKLLDFGLAQMMVPVADASPLTSQAPTHTLQARTQPGQILGTPAYMSPEQARGLRVDRRADIWAFGCVLYEMLTGKRPFDGPTVSDVLAAVLERDPDLEALPTATPPAVRRLVRRCLTKDRADRLRDIGDARIELQDAMRPDPALAAEPAPTAWRWPALAALAASLLTAAAGWLLLRPPTDPPRVARFVVPGVAGNIAISPDGSRFVYSTRRGLGLESRSRDRLETTTFGDLGAITVNPFFSPDGEWIAYFDGATLKKAPASGGKPLPLAENLLEAVGTWGPDGIVIGDVNGLARVPIEGGTPEPLLRMGESGEQATDPQLLPGQRAILYTVMPSNVGWGGIGVERSARIEVFDLDAGKPKTIIPSGSHGRFVPTGHVVYLAGATMHAVRFDLDRLEVTGEPVQVTPEVGLYDFAVSDEGTLLYLTGKLPANTLVWVDRDGTEEPVGAPPRAYMLPRLSPDGSRIALDVAGPSNRDIWLWDFRRQSLDRFTVGPAGNTLVAWSRDGSQLAFGSFRFGPLNLFLQPVDGSRAPERLLESERTQMPMSFAPDGRLLFTEYDPDTDRNIHALSLDGNRRVEPIVATDSAELVAEVSPDGRWIAYDSNESGQFEVYVRPYPDTTSGRWKVSTAGGRQPLWSRDGRELFYRDFAGALLVSPVTPGPSFSPGPVRSLLVGTSYAGAGAGGSGRTYDVSLDGSRFLMIKLEDVGDASAAVVVLGWFGELERLVPN